MMRKFAEVGATLNMRITQAELDALRKGLGTRVLAGADLTGADLRRADLRGVDLVGANLAGANLRKANLTNAALRGVDLKRILDLREANLTGVHLAQADLTRIDLHGVRLVRADLRGASLTEANLWGADLTRAILIGANFQATNLMRANLTEADLTDANLCEANLRNANLTGASLMGTNLSNANLLWADLRGANLSNAALREANLSSANLTGVDLTGIRSADAHGGGLPDVSRHLHGANLSQANLTDPQRIAARKLAAVLDRMTEADWLACEDPLPMLDLLRGRLSRRKQVLLAVGGCEPTFPCRDALEVAERFVDGHAGTEELERARESVARFLAEAEERDNSLMNSLPDEILRVLHILEIASGQADLWTDFHLRTGWDRPIIQMDDHAQLLRDVIGNPFRPAFVARPEWLAWNDGTLRRLAQGIYEERAFERMPVLADALEEAGCTDPAVLDHCRGRGPHIRGCFVIDTLLGQS